MSTCPRKAPSTSSSTSGASVHHSSLSFFRVGLHRYLKLVGQSGMHTGLPLGKQAGIVARPETSRVSIGFLSYQDCVWISFGLVFESGILIHLYIFGLNRERSKLGDNVRARKPSPRCANGHYFSERRYATHNLSSLYG